MERTNVILTRGAFFEGRLSFEGSARLIGQFKGEIISPGLLIVEPGAQVTARAEIGSLVLKGCMKGEVRALKKIELLKGSEFYGKLSAPKLYVEQGALFEGLSLKGTENVQTNDS